MTAEQFANKALAVLSRKGRALAFGFGMDPNRPNTAGVKVSVAGVDYEMSMVQPPAALVEGAYAQMLDACHRFAKENDR